MVGCLVKTSSRHKSIVFRATRGQLVVAYVSTIAAGASVVMADGLIALPRVHLVPLALFVGLVVLGNLWTVSLAGREAISLSLTPGFAAAVLFGPGFGALAIGLGGLISLGVVQRRGPLRVAFNVGQDALLGWVTGVTFVLLRTRPDMSLTSNALAFCAAAVAYLALNVLISSGLIALHGRPALRDCFLSMKAGGVFYFAMAPLGALLANAYAQSPWTLVYFPLLMWIVHEGFALFGHLRSDTDKALVLLADTLDKRDPYTAEHSKRVADHSERIAVAMGLPLDTVELVVSAAHIHDLGKISIDNRILFKEGKLTEEERRQINKHPAAGAALAGQFNLFGAGADIIMHHHERWDGTGYPEGLSGEDIPLGARIIAVADVYDAMTSDRPYRAALSHEVAIAELANGAGTQFDERCVEAFLSLDGERARKVRPAGGSVYAHA